MLDRVLAAIVALTLGALLVQCLCALATIALHRLASVVGSLGVMLLVVVFAIGAIAKVFGGFRTRDRRSLREHRAEQRSLRQSVRRPATEVPVEAEQVEPDDDPAINDGEEDEA